MPQWLIDIPANFWAVLGQMAPYLLFGFLMAGVLSVVISPKWVQRNLGGRGLWSVLKASALGVPLPLCSCSVIPVAASIRRHGASKGATTAFLISTPQTGVDSVFATYALLGPVFAIYRPLAALVSGIVGGIAVSLSEASGSAEAPEPCTEVCCTEKGQSNWLARTLKYGFVTLPGDIGPALLIGLALAALISAAVPEGYFSQVVPPGPLQILVLMAVGVPIYICATASIPVAAGLILMGVSPGAAFALLMTGPATNAATLTTIWKIMGKRTCVIYLATMMVMAFAGGLLLDSIISPQQVRSVMQHHRSDGWLGTVSAIALLAVLGSAIVRRHMSPRADDTDASYDRTVNLAVTGMTCGHCASSVREALMTCDQVQAVVVDVHAGRARVSGGDMDPVALCKAVEAAGYSAAQEPDLPSPQQEGRAEGEV